MRKVIQILLSLLLVCSMIAPSLTLAASKEVKQGWEETNKGYYYHDNNGNLVKGLQEIKNEKYYFDESGLLQFGWKTINGNEYFFDSVSGAAKKGFFNQTTHWYYGDPSGSLHKGDLDYKGKQFHFNNRGQMDRGWVKLTSIDKLVYKSATMLKVLQPEKVDGNTILEVTGEYGPALLTVNYNGRKAYVKKHEVGIFDQSGVETLKIYAKQIDNLKTALQIYEKYNRILNTETNPKKTDVNLSEMSQHLSKLSKTMNDCHLPTFFMDKLAEKMIAPGAQLKYDIMSEHLNELEAELRVIQQVTILDKAFEELNYVNAEFGKFIDDVDKVLKLYNDIMEGIVKLGPTVNTLSEVTKIMGDSARDLQAIMPTEDEISKRIDAVSRMNKDLDKISQDLEHLDRSMKDLDLKPLVEKSDDFMNTAYKHMEEMQKKTPTVFSDLNEGLDAVNNLFDSANKVASYKVDVPAAAHNIGNVDLTNSLRDLGASPENVYDSSKDKDLSFMLDISPGIGTVKQIGELKTGEDLVTHEKYSPTDYALGTLSLVTGGTSRVVGRTVGTIGDLEKKGKKLEEAAKATKATKSGEIVLDKVKTYEQARNKTLELIGDMGPNSKPYEGTLEKSAGYGKVVGRQSEDGKVRWRLDYDPDKGPHINVEDYRGGKGANAKKYAIPFEGDEETFKSLLKHLNK